MQTGFSVQHTITAVPAADGDFSPILRAGGGSFFVRVEREVSSSVYVMKSGTLLFKARSLKPLVPGDVLFVSARYDSAAKELQLAVQPSPDSVLSSAFLAESGIPDDPLTGRIIAVLCGLGARLDPVRIKQARTIASRYSGRETEVGEVSAVLLDKKMDADSEAINAVLSFDLGDKQHHRNSGESNSDRRFLKEFNKHRDSSANWIAVPFSLSPDVAGSVLSGCIRFLCDEKLSVVKQCSVTVLTAQRRWFFDIQYADATTGNGVAVTTYSDPVLSDEKIKIFNIMVEDFSHFFDTLIERFIYQKDLYHVYSGRGGDAFSVSTIV